MNTSDYINFYLLASANFCIHIIWLVRMPPNLNNYTALFYLMRKGYVDSSPKKPISIFGGYLTTAVNVTEYDNLIKNTNFQ